MSPQSRQKQDPKMHLYFKILQEHGSRHGKVIQHDCSDHISHTTYWFLTWKSVAHVIVKIVVF